MRQSIVLGDATTLTVLLRDELSEDDQRSLDIRKKQRHQELKAKLNAKRRHGAQPNQAASDGSAKSFAWLYSGLDAPCELNGELNGELIYATNGKLYSVTCTMVIYHWITITANA